jgi:hypothetical protein
MARRRLAKMLAVGSLSCVSLVVADCEAGLLAATEEAAEVLLSTAGALPWARDDVAVVAVASSSIGEDSTASATDSVVTGRDMEMAGLGPAPLVAWLPRRLRTCDVLAQLAAAGRADESPLSDSSLLEERTMGWDADEGIGMGWLCCREADLDDDEAPKGRWVLMLFMDDKSWRV